MTLTKRIIDVLDGRGHSLDIDPVMLVEFASRNKVLLHVLRILNIEGSLRASQERAMMRVVEVIRVLSKILRGYDYAFFKLVKPVSYVPADIDLLVRADQAKKITKTIAGLGYRLVVKDPYCITLAKGGSMIDLYTQPSVGGIIFIDGQKLLDHTGIAEFSGVEARVLEKYAEALVTASHAIYKEQIYTLNDYITTKSWISAKSLKLAEELKCKSALKLSIKINHMIERGALETPYKLPPPLWLINMIHKFREDPLTRTTLAHIFNKTQDS
ncbi:MAG: hypothetical protein QXR14_04200, partial [Sulfolobales archaeon]